MNLLERGEYKQKIISKFLNSSNIVDILLPTSDSNFEKDDQLLGNESLAIKGHIFPFRYVPGTQEKAESYICMDVINKGKSSMMNTNIIYIWAFTHKNLMKYSRLGISGSRVDILISDIDKILNGSLEFGIGKIQFESLQLYEPAQNYYGYVLTYSVPDFIVKGD